jgi:hypothetical protein
MKKQQSISVDVIYSLIDQLILDSKRLGESSLADQLYIALHMGSSSLEVLGAVRQTLIENEKTATKFLKESEIKQTITYIDQLYGRK